MNILRRGIAESLSQEWKHLMPIGNIPLPVLLRDLVEVGSRHSFDISC